MDMKKSAGPNSVPVFLLKTFKLFFAVWLSRLVNLCFEVGVFPAILRIANVTPLHEKESNLDFLNYRPISLLSVISKIYEKLIYTIIYLYLTKKKLIYSKLLDNGHCVCGIFVDLEKAFDNHKILCEKPDHYGLRSNVNKLIKSYLENRKQYVAINGFDSEIRNLLCGVPQGSLLGPLIFLIYINDFRLCLNQCTAGHFADDTFIMYIAKK